MERKRERTGGTVRTVYVPTSLLTRCSLLNSIIFYRFLTLIQYLTHPLNEQKNCGAQFIATRQLCAKFL